MTEISAEEKSTNSVGNISIEDRVDISMAVGRYMRAIADVEKAEKKLDEEMKRIRQLLPASKRFVVRDDYEYFLVTTIESGEFSVVPIECL